MSRKGTTSGELSLAPREVGELLDSCQVLEREALLAVAVACGIRRSDIVGLRWPDVDLEEGWVEFWEKKKDGQHRAPVSGRALKLLRQLWDVRDDGDEYVWPSDHHLNESGHISGKTAYNWLQEALSRAGLERRPFHALRATCIKLAQHRGWSEERTARLVNDRVETINEHYKTPTEEEMRETASEEPIV